jgi:hypothetical protein
VRVFNLAMLWGGIFWLCCLVLRAQRCGLFARYPYFFGYLGSVLCAVALNLALLPTSSRRYHVGYWIGEFVSAVAGFGVTWEIYSHVLAPYRGVRRMARVLLAIVLVAVVGEALMGLGNAPMKTLMPITLELERNLRVVQALLLLAVVGLIVHYAIPMGRNIRYMLAGYGLYIGCAVIGFGLRAQWGQVFEIGRYQVQQVAWNITSMIWFAGMWSYSENPVPDMSLECDYDRISQDTVRALGRLRSHVTQSWRV